MKNKMMLFRIFLVFSLAFIACDDNSNSQQSFRDIVQQEFMNSDTNQDGVISGGEIDAVINKDFDVMDVNMDGVITAADHVGSEYLEEFNEEALELEASNRGELNDDANDDDVLSFEEYSNAVQNQFIELADTNDDGQVSLDEVLAFHFGPSPGDG